MIGLRRSADKLDGSNNPIERKSNVVLKKLKLNFPLCMKKRLLIIEALGDNVEKRLNNLNNELYGARRRNYGTTI